jgi:LPS sulfotransferase NodH
MEPTPLICILCNPRSGSTALRAAFGTNGQLMDCGEIFHDDRSLAHPPFLDFLEQWPRPLLAMLDHREANAVSDAFLKRLRSDARGRSILIDVKHNSWGVLRPLWKFPHEPSLFFNLLRDLETRFLFLKRRNLADQVISFHLATRSELWHETLTPENAGNRLAPHELPAARAMELCSLFVEAEALTARWLGPYFYQLPLYYEDVFEGDAVAAKAAAELARFTGLKVDTAPLPLRRNRVAKREVITNYDEVCDIAGHVQGGSRPV